MTSLRRQLIVWMFGLLAVVGLAAASISYFLARNDAAELLDQQLRLVARSIDEGSQLASMQQGYISESAAEARRDFVIQVWYKHKPVRVSRPDFDLPRGKKTGFSDVAAREGMWRVYTIVYPERTVQVSQSDTLRREIAASSALRSLAPVLGLMPLLWLLSASGVRRTLKPLEAVTLAATARDAHSLEPLPLNAIPREVLPLIVEMNALLARLDKAMEAQRQFISDAAHELRTPLAAMHLQTENLLQCRSPEDMKNLIAELMAGVQRATHLVNQLLKMARFEARQQSAQHEIDLAEVVKSCIGHFIPLAEKRRIDLGMVRIEHVRVISNADDLIVLFNNLLDNAIRYIEEGGRIDVSLFQSGGHAVVEIADNGPGIPEVLLSRVFDRFFRASSQQTEGSGIGLAIVKTIAQRESAEITLRNRTDGNGLVARVIFPLPGA